MYGDRYIVAERMIIQYVYCEEEQNIDHPTPYWNVVRFEEEWWSVSIELREVSGNGHKKKLNKS